MPKVLAMTLMFLCLAGCEKRSGSEEAFKRELATGLAFPLVEQEVVDQVVYPANVLPIREVDVLAESDGFLNNFNLQVGQTVGRNQTIMAIRNPDPLVGFKAFQLKAPISGVVSRLRVHPGDRVQVGRPLLTLIDIKNLKIQIHLNQEDLAKISAGQEASWSFGDNKVPLRVSAVDHVLDPQTGSALCELQPKNLAALKKSIVAGMMGRVEFSLDRKKILKASDDSIYYRNQIPHLLVLDKEHRVSYKPVEISKRIDGSVEIKSGVMPGVSVVSNLSAPVDEGEVIQVANEDQTH